jgi:uncharacterized protein DUF664
MDIFTADVHAVQTADERSQFEAFLDRYRGLLNNCLNGLTEDEVRRRLVPSKTTLLGLVKHVTFLEQVWSREAITGEPRTSFGLPASVDESFDLTLDDTIDSVTAAHREVCEQSARAVASLDLDDVVRGHRLGEMTLRWIYLHVLRELAQHCGHADILREQLLAARA